MCQNGFPSLSPSDLTTDGVELWLGAALHALWGAGLVERAAEQREQHPASISSQDEQPTADQAQPFGIAVSAAT